MSKKAIAPALLFLLILAAYSCQREFILLESSDQLGYSHDTVSFDTLFRGRVSPTRRLALYNPSAMLLTIPSIRLAKGEESPYVALIDGLQGTEARNIRIGQGDSLLIFLRLRSDVVLNDTITACNDQLVIESARGSHVLQLRAWIMNFLPLRQEDLQSDLELIGPPARLADSSLVVPEGVTLTLRDGASIYFPPRANLEVRGKLWLEGKVGKPVVLGADRLDQSHRFEYGLWGGVVLHPSSVGSTVRHAVIRNAAIALRVEEYDQIPLEVRHSQLLYYSLDGLQLNHSRAHVFGSIIAQGSRSAIHLLKQSSCEVMQSTLFSDLPDLQLRSGPLLKMQPPSIGKENTLKIQNSIIWGDRDEEVVCTTAEYSPTHFGIRYSIAPIAESELYLVNIFTGIVSKNPKLKSPTTGHFDLMEDSPARAIASPEPLRNLPPELSLDLRGQPWIRSGSHPDAGALQYIQGK